MKVILLIILLFFACGLAMVLMQRLLAISQRVGELRGELGRKNDLMQEQFSSLQKQQARIDAEQVLAQENDATQIIEGEIEETKPTDKPKEH